LTPRILAVFGTRPELVKLAPLFAELRRAGLAPRLVSTAQHRGLLDDALAAFGVRPHLDLDLMREGQRPAEVLARLRRRLPDVLRRERPDLVLVQGDTASACAAALCARELGIPVAHVEAGLRSGDLRNPWPEEGQRIRIDRAASMLFAPTRRAKRNLLRERLKGEVFVTGNTGVDALKARLRRPLPGSALLRRLPRGARLLLATLHRRESFGRPLAGMLRALVGLAERRADLHVVFPVHPNPAVRAAARALRHPRVHATPPLPYPEFLALLRRSDLLLTDSGGLQEEAPVLRVPTLVARKVTERPELLESGGGLLVGTDPARIARAVGRILDDDALRRRMRRAGSPFGDGRAARRIARFLRWRFGLGSRPAEWTGGVRTACGRRRARAPSARETPRARARAPRGARGAG
jgi:UDP-N-acetylglucosamine 2-epimerase (non-hydrolysing)